MDQSQLSQILDIAARVLDGSWSYFAPVGERSLDSLVVFRFRGRPRVSETIDLDQSVVPASTMVAWAWSLALDPSWSVPEREAEQAH